MRKTWVHALLIAGMLLTSSGVQLMACVADPTHQACEGHAFISAGKKCSHSHCHHDEAPLSKSGHSKGPLQPLACVQACSAGLATLKPEVPFALLSQAVTASFAATLPESFILSSEPASIFHPPA